MLSGLRFFILACLFLLSFGMAAQPDSLQVQKQKGRTPRPDTLNKPLVIKADSSKVRGGIVKADTTARKAIAKDTAAVKGPDIAIAKTPKKRKHSPLVASLLSTAVPGAGQIYNRKYWKAPIVWAAVGGMGYLIYTNRKSYILARDSYRAVVDDDPLTLPDASLSSYSSGQIKSYRDQTQRFYELSIIGFSAMYILNITDAFVDGHLWHFEMSDDLSLSIDPVSSPASGMGFSVSIQW